MPRLEVSPAQRHPASQQGGGGRWKPGWRSLGEVGGWRFFTILLISCRIVLFSINLEVELNEEKIVWMKVKVSFEFVKLSMTCELWIGGSFPCTSFQLSWRGRDEPNESESFIILSEFLSTFLVNVSAWYGLENESTRFIKCKSISLYCSEKINTPTSWKLKKKKLKNPPN